jgi:hypothetical protein
VAFSFSYITFGFSFFSRAFYIFFPLLAFYTLFHFKSRFTGGFLGSFFSKGAAFFSVLLVLLCLVSLSAFLLDTLQPYTPNSNSQMSPSTAFFINNVNGNLVCNISTSLDISGQLFFKSVEIGKMNIQPIPFGEDVKALYSNDSQYVDSLFHDKGYDFLLFSRTFETRAIFADGWYWAPAATNASSLISDNSAFNRVYDDNRAITFAYVK